MQRAQLQLDNIINGQNDKKATQIKAIEDFLFSTHTPKNYSGKDGYEVEFIKGFEDTCIIIEQFTSKDPKTMTTLEFYQKLDFVKEQLKRKKR